MRKRRVQNEGKGVVGRSHMNRPSRHFKQEVRLPKPPWTAAPSAARLALSLSLRLQIFSSMWCVMIPVLGCGNVRVGNFFLFFF